jgi:hypothetical protein
MLVVVPAIMPLSWNFSAHRFVSFGCADQRLPEQGRNRSLASGTRSRCASHLRMVHFLSEDQGVPGQPLR